MCYANKYCQDVGLQMQDSITPFSYISREENEDKIITLKLMRIVAYITALEELS